MKSHNMEYNSQKEDLIISEYGRNVQNLIEYAKTEKDVLERQRMAESIVELMHMMNPANKSNDDYKEKLWRHFFRIAKYEINVIPTIGEVPTPEDDIPRAMSLEYPSKVNTFRHYGQYVKQLIEKAIEMEDKEKQDEFCMVIASYMKLAYRTWNKEHFVSDEVIKEDLSRMSKGILTLTEDETIDVSAAINKEKRKQWTSKRPSGRNNNHRQQRGVGRKRR